MNLPNLLGQGLRLLRGCVVMGLAWTPAWIALFFGLVGLILVVFRPGPDPDVGTLQMVTTMGWVGFCSGSLFGLVVALAGHGRAGGSVSRGRAVLWGILAAAAYPLLTGRADQVIWTCPFGALIAAGLGTIPGGRRILHLAFTAISSESR
jgi:predicted small integral membrane protein